MMFDFVKIISQGLIRTTPYEEAFYPPLVTRRLPRSSGSATICPVG